MSRWREQKLRADNTSVIVVFFEEGGTHASQSKHSRTNEQQETDTDTASEVSAPTTPREQTTSLINGVPECEKPPLVRTMAFRCTDSQDIKHSSFVPIEEGPPCIAREITVSSE